MFTLDGVPLIYNGMEVGDTTESGAPALFEKLPIFWPIGERRPEFPRFYKAITAMRRASPALRRGRFEWLHNSEETRVLTFLRHDVREEIMIAINLSNRPFFGAVDIDNGDAFKDLGPYVGTPLQPDVFTADKPQLQRRAGLPVVSLDAWGYRFFRRVVR